MPAHSVRLNLIQRELWNKSTISKKHQSTCRQYICGIECTCYPYGMRLKEWAYSLTDEISSASEKSKSQVVSDIESGHNVKTKYKSSYSWREGNDVRVVHGQNGNTSERMPTAPRRTILEIFPHTRRN